MQNEIESDTPTFIQSCAICAGFAMLTVLALWALINYPQSLL